MPADLVLANLDYDDFCGAYERAYVELNKEPAT